MQYKVFTVYDSKVKFYKTPFVLRTAGEALRGWQEVSNDKTTQIGKYPADFTLFEIGEWDEESARFEQYEVKKNLGSALEYQINRTEGNQE